MMNTTALSLLGMLATVVVACNTPASASPSPATNAPAPVAAPATNDAAVVRIAVGQDGFQPSMVHAEKGKKLTLRFTRTTDATCAKQVDFPELGIKRELPLNQPVDIDIPTSEARDLGFQCGMGMYKSSVMIH